MSALPTAEAVSDRNVEHKEREAKKGGSRLIGRILPPAVRLWLRSQVEQVDQLNIDLEGRDRQIIKGYIPGVAITAQQVIYEGLHVSEVALSAGDIRINIGQVIRGKPLRLLNPFPVLGQIVLSADDMHRSAQSSLLQAGLLDFWRSLIQVPAIAQDIKNEHGQLPIHSDVTLLTPEIRLADDCLGLSFYPAVDSETSKAPVVLATKLSILEGQYLELSKPVWLSCLEKLEQYSIDSGVCKHIPSLDGFQWNLGAETELTSIEISVAQLICGGQVTVQP